jgi:hypothetical protein
MSVWTRFLPHRATSATRSAANPNLEIFRFATYVSFPLAIMVYFVLLMSPQSWSGLIRWAGRPRMVPQIRQALPRLLLQA